MVPSSDIGFKLGNDAKVGPSGTDRVSNWVEADLGKTPIQILRLSALIHSPISDMAYQYY